jgi:putative tricarboxylic transport membrane protein
MLQNDRWMSFAFSSFILIFSLAILISSILTLKIEAATTPILVGSILIVLTTIVVIKEFRSAKGLTVLKETNKNEDTSEEPSIVRPWWVMFLLAFAYYILVIYLGFFLSTILFLLIVPYIYKYKNWKVTIISCFVYMMVYWIGFEMLMEIRFPDGVLFS